MEPDASALGRSRTRLGCPEGDLAGRGAFGLAGRRQVWRRTARMTEADRGRWARTRHAWVLRGTILGPVVPPARTGLPRSNSDKRGVRISSLRIMGTFPLPASGEYEDPDGDRRPERLTEPDELLAGEEPLVLFDPEARHAPEPVAAGRTPAQPIRKVEHLDRMAPREFSGWLECCRLFPLVLHRHKGVVTDCGGI